MPLEIDDRAEEVKEAPRESGGESSLPDLARSGQEKPKDQADKEGQQKELRKRGGTPSSSCLPRVDLDVDDKGKLTITVADKSISLDISDKPLSKLPAARMLHAESVMEAGDARRTHGEGDLRIGDRPDKKAKPEESKPAVVSPEQAAKDFEKKADAGLAEVHKSLKLTDDGSSPRAVPFQENFKVTADKTLLDLAREQLGPHATKEQLELYSSQIKSVNHLRGKQRDIVVHAGDVLKMPGQATDGGIYTVEGGTTDTNWMDGSFKMVLKDGVSRAHFQKGGAEVDISWNKADAEATIETTVKGNKTIEVRGDGLVREQSGVKKHGESGDYLEWHTTRETMPKNGGTIVTEFGQDDKKVRATESRNGETVVEEYDRDGNLRRSTKTATEGRHVVYNFEHGKWDKQLNIEEPKGFRTVLEPDKESGSYSGTRKDAHGNVVETVAVVGTKIVYTDVHTGRSRAETYVEPKGNRIGFEMHALGAYDAKTGTLSREFGQIKVVDSFASGRLDIVLPEGTIVGVSTHGEMNTLNGKTGEVTVMHSDGSGVHMYPDGSIDRWGPEAGDNAKNEKLSPVEQDFLKKHPDVDRREFAEIHRRFDGNAERLDKFYGELAKLDSARNLNPQEKLALRKDIMHQVAAPAEIYQGVTQSCNIAVIQRDMAITSPDKFVHTIVTAVSDGVFDTPDGAHVPLDVSNLKMADSSGRDLASRIYQTAALQIEFWPARQFVNTPDGVGRLLPTDQSPPGTKREVFDGLTGMEIADVRYKLTGEEKAVGFINSVVELNKAIELNGGPPMTVFVDGSTKPFDGPKSDHSPNHVVTIVGIESGPPMKYLVQNQWGLESDHSTRATAIPAQDLVDNMTIWRKDGVVQSEKDLGRVLTAGEHSKVYDVSRDGRSYNRDETAKAEAGNRAHQIKVGASREGKSRSSATKS